MNRLFTNNIQKTWWKTMATVMASGEDNRVTLTANNKRKRFTLTHFSFDYEPSKVETQLKVNIQRLKTPSEENGRELQCDDEACGGGNTAGKELRDAAADSGFAGVESPWEVPFQDIRNLEYVGSGGQGTVFSGVHRGKMVAVKKVNDPKQTNIYHLRKLEHNNIIKFLGVCTKEPCYCIVMEYCSEGNVYQYIRKPNVIMLPKQIVGWAGQIANGMQYLHSNMIIHRDLKSLNVLVNDDNTVKITDFGTSRQIDGHSTVMTVVGSCAWMAPELIRNEPCNDRVDVWSYGILLWELLTQEIPYKGLNHGAIMFGVGSNRLSLPVPNKCPLELKNLLNRCWEPDAKNRPSFKQILAHLKWIKQGQFLSYTPQDYLAVRAEWREEIDSHFDTLEMSLNGQLGEDYELIVQRKEELKHAHEVRILYEQKLEKAEKLCEELDRCKRLNDQRQHELDRRERLLSDKMDLYRGMCGSCTSSDEEWPPENKRALIRKRRNLRILPKGEGHSPSDVFDSPMESIPVPIPNDRSLSPLINYCNHAGEFSNNGDTRNHGDARSPSYKRTDSSVISDDGSILPEVRKLIDSVTLKSRGHDREACLPRPSHSRHRRTKSVSAPLRRKGSKCSVRSLNFNRRNNHSSCDHSSHDHSSCDLTNSLDSSGGRKWVDLPRKRNISRDSGVSSSWNNGEDGDTESNGEEGESDDGLGEGPVSSVPTSPVHTPLRQIELAPPTVSTPTPRKGMFTRFLRRK